MNYIALDTNIFIHFKDFDQIDWKSLTSINDSFTIIIPPVVIDELDKHKYNKNPKISRRVKRILPKIENFIGKTQPDFNLKLIASRPGNKTFADNQLNKDEQDDCLLASLLEFRNQIDKDDRLVYITFDTGPRLKAQTLSIDCLKIPETLILPNEPDENEKKNKELERELSKFKNQMPKVVLGFIDNDFLFKVEKKRELKSKELFISESINKLKEQYNYLQKQTFENSTNNLLKVLDFYGLGDDQISTYNAQLDTFFEKYEAYYSSIYNRIVYQNDCVEIKLRIRNDGTAPANDIDVKLHFPDGFTLHIEKGLPKLLSEPTPPYLPKNRFDIQSRGYNLPIFGNNSIKQPSVIDLNAPNIVKTNSYDVGFHLMNLKHNQDFEFETLFLKYEDRYSAKNFTIDYKVMVSNYPEVISGKLNVLME